MEGKIFRRQGRLDGIYRSSVNLIVRTWKDHPFRVPLLLITALLTFTSSSFFLFQNPEHASALVQPNGRLFYGDATNTALRFQTNSYDFTFNGENTFTHGGSSSLIRFL